MRAEHVPRVGGWDIKRSRGGLIDVEFVVQYLVLAYAIDYPELTQNLGTIALLKRSVDLGLVSPLGQSVALHYQNLRDWIHERQLLGESEHVPIAEARGEALVDALWLEVFGETVG
jgi:glutamate-ammonia-ligase adenylyltransferase